MGARISVPSLPEEDIAELASLTRFSKEQIQRLYRRFTFLDKDRSGTLSPSEFLAIPEFSMNPLNHRTLAMFQLQQYLNEQHKLWSSSVAEKDDDQTSTFQEAFLIREFFHRLERNEFTNLEVDFLSFVQTLYIFSPHASIEEKMRFAFLTFNANGDGAIKPEELSNTLRAMVGDAMPTQDLGSIVDQTIKECDTMDHDGAISLSEFRRVFLARNMASKMGITIEE